MKTLSKRLKSEQQKIDKTSFYDCEEGITLVKKTASAKFQRLFVPSSISAGVRETTA